jgi:hypothetical protein
LPNENKEEGPVTLEDRVQALRLHAFRRAEDLGNLSAACRKSASRARCSTAGSTILHEHWRVEFRRRYFTRLPQRSLDGFVRFYNLKRSHHGYRTRGRTPAALFRGARE